MEEKWGTGRGRSLRKWEERRERRIYVKGIKL